LLESLQDLRNFGKSVELKVKAHQPVAQGSIPDTQQLHCKVERIRGHSPEIRMPTLRRPKPGVLKLLVTPKRRQAVRHVPRNLLAGACRGGEIEQRPIGVERADFDRAKFRLGHLDLASRPRLSRGQAQIERDPVTDQADLGQRYLLRDALRVAESQAVYCSEPSALMPREKFARPSR
jgi:hypothetical protein